MPRNFLVTGRPGCGKTTLILRIVSELEERGFRVGGILCPEIREAGKRVGFSIIDIMTGESKILAHVNSNGPKVGKYGVNVENVDEISRRAIRRALEEADVIVIDEIAPMELHSEEFKKAVEEALSSEKPLLAAIHQKSNFGFIGKIKRRDDVTLLTVTSENREALRKELLNLILRSLANTS